MIENLMLKSIKDLSIVSGFEMKQKTKKYENEGYSVIHLELGDPDFNTPKNIKTAATKAIDEGKTHYTASLGIPAFRKIIASYIRKQKNMPFVIDDNIVVTPGAKPILFYTFLSFVKPGDEVIIQNPSFSNYKVMANMQQAKIIYLKGTEENGFRIKAEDLFPLVNKKTKLLILSSPNNPTGALIEKKEITKMAEFLKDKNIVILSDEIYDRLCFDGKKPVSIASLPGMAKKTIIVDGFSKSYAMTGWRLGYGVMPKAITKTINTLLTISNSCTATFTQIAGIEAYSGPQQAAENIKAIFEKRRNLLVNGLNQLPGVTCSMPDGAFYAFPNFKSYNMTSDKMCQYLLETAHIATLSGNTFGIDLDGYIRISYATEESILEEALNRLETALKKLR